MTDDVPIYVLDSFSMLALFQAEPGAPKVRALLENGSLGEAKLLMAVVNLGEVVYKTIQRWNQGCADEILATMLAYPIEFVEVTRSLALSGARVKGSHAMSYADCIAAALAMSLNAIVVTGDPEFHLVESLIKIEWLPQPQRS